MPTRGDWWAKSLKRQKRNDSHPFLAQVYREILRLIDGLRPGPVVA